MTRHSLKLLVTFCFVVLGSMVTFGFSSGPDPGYTNAPGDIDTCVNCHDQFQLNTGSGQVSLTGLPQVYQPGQTYPLTISVEQQGRTRWGFQATALTANGEKAGTFVLTDPNLTRIQSSSVSGKLRDYIEHTQAGTQNGTPRKATWRFSWKAPATDAGPVTFYFCGNAANGDNTNQGDYIYSSVALTNSPTSQLAVKLLAPNGGETFQTGQTVEVKWETTNASQAESHEVRLSTDSGATFPTRIAAALSPQAQSFSWQIPETLSSTTARLRVEAYPKGGLPPITTASAGDFAIVRSNAMTITNVTPGTAAIGAKPTVTITGVNFVAGSQVDFGSGIKVKSVELVSPTQLSVKLKIKATATAGLRDVKVTTPTGTTAIKTGAFRIT
ncbi:MAG: hypothetical protein K1Y36_16935 [Blastocatellia bacterium]|nr:hypothetical protein [Blastocatellia bacterium]